ncbi:hypothetical protein HNE_2437 [Hyphomonas neptunium ATCC 15444]|uniref:Uncharacterized protein n=2 Tax=Hyphomonas TaxID=85 RepID=Q0BZG1_HYPNA|nr:MULTISPECIES: hypothetical protein [Hyphomonas]ABI78853.1 hypothetical protein HNE_2437 [Hyphomonas neptunium ATCC 15444]KCZ95221.1 hypothetical protein HHI_06109 [Hyphomonas hirschiana VP5]
MTADQAAAKEEERDPRGLSPLMMQPQRLRGQLIARLQQQDITGITPPDVPTIVSALLPQPVPLPASAWESASDPAAQGWFSAALPALQKACLGLDLAQITSDGAVQERFPLRLFSPTAWLLRLRYPLGPAIRTAEFIVDLEAPDGVQVVPLCGRSQEFHDRLAAYKVGSCGDADCVADFTRIFCTVLQGEEGMFMPCESRDELLSRFLGTPDGKLLDAITPWVRLTPPSGVSLPAIEVHIFHGPMLYGQNAYLASLILTLPRHGAPENVNVGIWMFDDEGLWPDKLPIVPARRDALTFAFYPLRSGQ